MPNVAWIWLPLWSLLVVSIAIWDCYARRIPNCLVACLVALYPIAWWCQGAILREFLNSVLSALVVLAVLLAFWISRGCGAGDVKLFAGLSLYCSGFQAVAGLILTFGFAGIWAGLEVQKGACNESQSHSTANQTLGLPLGSFGCVAFLFVHWISFWYR